MWCWVMGGAFVGIAIVVYVVRWIRRAIYFGTAPPER